ncbi:MAG: hypothetical protein QOD94_1049 [Alphaproteobacteria bacterium]|jgi:hypothetical protein|nr:hypothetical protein [Alphaproteobacteria bacterium]
MRRHFDWRSLAIIGLAALVGAAWAGYNLRLAGDRRDEAVFDALIWIVFATPFATFIGWLVARPRERWLAVAVCFAIYFFAIFAAARIERVIVGEAIAAASGHALYFRLCLVFDLLGCLGVALHRALHVGTMHVSTEPGHRVAPSKD